MLNWLFTQTPLLFLTQSFWRDEAFSYLLAKKSILDIIVLSAKDFNPPLYHLLLHFWLKVFGGSEISMRSLSLIFYWATLYICFLFLQEIFKFNLKKSLLYLCLFILNPFLTYYAFEARTYSFLAFLATLSYFSLYRKNYKVYFISTILGLYTHYFMLFVVFSQLVFSYTLRLGKSINALPEGGFSRKIIIKSLFIFSPWIILVFFVKRFSSSFWIDKTNLQTFINLLGIVYTGFERNILWVSMLLIFILTVAIIKIKNKNPEPDNQLFLYLSLWGIGIPFVVAVISLFKPIFFPRYFIFSSVGLLLLLVYSLEKMKIRARILIFILLLIFAVNYQKNQIQNRKKTNFLKVSKEIKTQAKKDDLIYVTNELDFFTVKYYFPGNKVYIYYKTYTEIPDFVGKVLISKTDIAASLPFYPQRAFILKSNGTYNVQALY